MTDRQVVLRCGPSFVPGGGREVRVIIGGGNEIIILLINET